MKKIILLFSLLVVAFSAAAQGTSTLYSSYYLDRMPVSNKLNAALIPEQGGYFAMPFLGGFNFTAGSNIGMESFLFPTSDAKVYDTLLSPNVSSSDAIGNLPKYLGVDFNMEINILSVGFTSWGGFNTVDINMQTSGGVYISRDLVSFLKDGGDATYDLSGTSANMSAYMEVALGHARKINDRLTVGAKVKYIAGLAALNANLDDTTISLSGDEWSINPVVSGTLSMKGATIDEDNNLDFDMSKLGMAGNGLAFDFGATYRLLDKISILDGLELSAAVNDLGFICWSGGNSTLTSSSDGLSFNGFDEIDTDKFDSQMDDLEDDLDNMMSIDAASSSKSYTQLLTVNMTAGAEAIFLDDRITVGVLYTTYMRQGINASHQGTFSLNLKPCRGIQGAVIYSASSYGSNFGGVINICPRGFNFYVGADYGVPKLTSSFIPADASFGLNLSMGMVFTWGEKSRREMRREAQGL